MTTCSSIRLIVGLGNPGEKYQSTRHNAGFWFVNAVAKSKGVVFKQEAGFKGGVTCVSFQGEKVWLLKPFTYVNVSGESLRAFVDFYKIPTERILVVHDEIDLPNGTAKIKWAGGHGGHNGLRSIFAHLNQNFWRLRLGVGRPGNREDVVDYVLKKPDAQGRLAVDDAIARALTTLDDLTHGEMQRAIRKLHADAAAR